MTAENEAIVRRWVDEVLSQGRLQVIDAICAPEFVNHSAEGHLPAGPEGVRQGVVLLRSAFPDLHVTVEDLVAHDDRVVWRFTCRGTHKGEFNGIAPTGNPVAYAGIVMARIAGGRFREAWGVTDTLTLLEQVGAIRVTAAGTG